MKVLKYLFLLLLIVFIGGAVFFSLKDGSYSITERKIIQAHPSVIYEQISDFEKWQNWNPWTSSPGVTNTLGEQTTGIDGSYSFTDEYGNGSMTFTELNPDSSVTALMNYNTSLTESQSDVTMSLNPTQSGTEVVWNIKGEDGLKNKIFNFIFGLDLEEEIRPMYKEGLNNLDQFLVAEMKKYEISNPGIVEYGGGFILYQTTSSSKAAFETDKTNMLQDVMKYMKEKNISMYGMPIIIYEKIDDVNGNVMFSTAVPVRDRVIPDPSETKVLCTYIEPTRAVKTTLTGTHNHLQEAWNKSELFMAQQGYIPAVQAPFEIYKTDPTTLPNPANNITEIYLPIVSND